MKIFEIALDPLLRQSKSTSNNIKVNFLFDTREREREAKSKSQGSYPFCPSLRL